MISNEGIPSMHTDNESSEQMTQFGFITSEILNILLNRSFLSKRICQTPCNLSLSPLSNLIVSWTYIDATSALLDEMAGIILPAIYLILKAVSNSMPKLNALKLVAAITKSNAS